MLCRTANGLMKGVTKGIDIQMKVIFAVILISISRYLDIDIDILIKGIFAANSSKRLFHNC